MQFSHQESLDVSSLGLIAQGRPGRIRNKVGDVACGYAAGCAAAQLLPPEVDRAAIDRNPGSHCASGAVVERLRDLARDHGLDLSKVEQAARDAGWEVVS